MTTKILANLDLNRNIPIIDKALLKGYFSYIYCRYINFVVIRLSIKLYINIQQLPINLFNLLTLKLDIDLLLRRYLDPANDPLSIHLKESGRTDFELSE